jgi:DNA-binding transcriptional LysR family regulator
MDLRRLNHVLYLAEELNFARAAERAALSQSAFSRSIQTLETEIGMSLFDRATRRVQLTPVGRILAERARGLLFDANDLARELAQLKTGALGDVSLGAGPNVAHSILPGLLEDLRRTHPGIHLKIEVNGVDSLLPHLLAEKLDFFLADAANLAPDEDLDVRLLPKHRIGLFCRAGHPLLAKPEPTLGDALQYGLATPSLSDSTRRLANRLFLARCNAPFDAAIECDNLPVLRELVERTDLILANTREGMRRDLETGAIVELHIPLHQNMENQWGIVRLAGRTQTPAALLLMDMLAERSAQLTAPGTLGTTPAPAAAAPSPRTPAASASAPADTGAAARKAARTPRRRSPA